jgi:small GTP-binding protein
MIMKILTLTDIIHRTLCISRNDVLPLVKYLDLPEALLQRPEREAAIAISTHLRKMGSNDIATLFRRGDGVSYEEVVVDVGEKLKVKEVSAENTVAKNEDLILMKLFEDALTHMSEDEKRGLFQSMGISEYDLPVGAATTFVIQQMLRHYGGFTVYQVSLVVANMVSRALLGSGLSFATNAALTRTIGAMLGPIGWIATGLWLAVDIAGPAFRKTVPAVIHVAMLRQMLERRVNIGVVGLGSSGKDALLGAVFGLAGNVDPVAGSTSEAVMYAIGHKGNATVINYPGFNDYRPSVNRATDENLHRTDLFIMVVDISRGISGAELDILNKLKTFKQPILVCLNKIDLVRNSDELGRLRKAALERLGGALSDYSYSHLENGKQPFIATSFDPDPRLGQRKAGCEAVHTWITECLAQHGKHPQALPPFTD